MADAGQEIATPWVGITVSIDPGRRLRRGVPYLYTPQSYSAAVFAAGGVPVLLAPGDAASAARSLERCDALVLSGGDQLPTHFGAAGPRESTGDGEGPPRDAEDAARIAWERALIDAATERRLPVLGVCYGMQLLNLHFGGSLRAGFLPEESRHGGSGAVTTHPVAVRESSRVFDWIGARAEVASSHHQAIDRVAPSFRITASAPDDVVEAIESEEAPLFGIEWHPELDDTGPAIYAGLIAAARQRPANP